MSGNLVNYLIFRQFLTFLQNWFWLSNLISECLHTLLISTKIFIKFLLLDKKWQRLQYCNFHQCQHIFAVARWNHPYVGGGVQSFQLALWKLGASYPLATYKLPARWSSVGVILCRLGIGWRIRMRGTQKYSQNFFKTIFAENYNFAQTWVRRGKFCQNPNSTTTQLNLT